MLGGCQHAHALSRQAKMLAELRRGHARDWHSRPPWAGGDGLRDGPCRMIVGRWIGHRFCFAGCQPMTAINTLLTILRRPLPLWLLHSGREADIRYRVVRLTAFLLFDSARLTQ